MGRRFNPDYDRSVFINCPFDTDYLPLFRAIVFAVIECGLVPRCAQEAYDAGQVRIEKITGIIRDCRWGIHDISRTDLNPSGLPRFNMPFELGLFLGARQFGLAIHKRKSCLILDTEPYRYKEFLSDISGQDIHAHGNDPANAIRAVRDWLAISKAGRSLAGAQVIHEFFQIFSRELPDICGRVQLQADELTFVEYADFAYTWLKGFLSMME